MKLIEIAVQPNGAHRNYTTNVLNQPPEGWAFVPEDMETPNFPFGQVEVENGMVTAWHPMPLPSPEPEPDVPEPMDERLSALEAENHLLREQVAALSDQNEFHEELIVELANILYA